MTCENKKVCLKVINEDGTTLGGKAFEYNETWLGCWMCNNPVPEATEEEKAEK